MTTVPSVQGPLSGSINKSSYFGVTPPISTSRPTQREEEITVTLIEELRRQGVFESAEESHLRYV